MVNWGCLLAIFLAVAILVSSIGMYERWRWRTYKEITHTYPTFWQWKLIIDDCPQKKVYIPLH